MSYRYIAYIDESGDDGLRKVKPIDPDGASEWLVLSAVVVSAVNERETLRWIRDIRGRIGQTQGPGLHFQRLSADRRLMACEQVAALPIRCFAVISNKKNMRGYRNLRAEKVPARNWFYCWMGRLLLERVTTFCGWRNRMAGSPDAKLRIEFSERGGMSYAQFRAYLYWLRMRSDGRMLWLPQGDLDWSVIDYGQVHPFSHTLRAGLQLADLVAGSFYQAVDLKDDGTCHTQYAKALRERMCPGANRRIWDFGVKAMPSPLSKAMLADPQKEIFEFYGCPPYQMKW